MRKTMYFWLGGELSLLVKPATIRKSVDHQVNWRTHPCRTPAELDVICLLNRVTYLSQPFVRLCFILLVSGGTSDFNKHEIIQHLRKRFHRGNDSLDRNWHCVDVCGNALYSWMWCHQQCVRIHWWHNDECSEVIWRAFHAGLCFDSPSYCIICL